jgi:mono/diheme cytochrome c family protein
MKEVIMKKIFNIFVSGLMLGSTVLLILIGNVEGSEYDTGKKIFDNNCQICHGIKGNGKGPAASSFSPGPVDFTNEKFWQGNVDQKITDAIENGVGVMPAFSDIDTDQIKSIIDYMSHSFKPHG